MLARTNLAAESTDSSDAFATRDVQGKDKPDQQTVLKASKAAGALTRPTATTT